jgi:uncharacterized protein YkwD
MHSLRFRLPLLVCVLMTFAAPSAASAESCANAGIMPTAANIEQAQAATLCLINVEREKAGLPAVAHNATLEASATDTSRDMVARRYFGHVPPEGQTIADKMSSYLADAVQWNIGENLAWGEGQLATPGQTVIAWMNSPTHRANVLKPDFDEIGVGIVPGTPTAGPNGATYTTHHGRKTIGTKTGVAKSSGSVAKASPVSTATKTITKPTTKPKAKKKAKRCATASRAKSNKAKKAAKRACTARAKKAAKKA